MEPLEERHRRYADEGRIMQGLPGERAGMINVELDLKVVRVDRDVLLSKVRRVVERRHVVERLEGIDLEADPADPAGGIEQPAGFQPKVPRLVVTTRHQW